MTPEPTPVRVALDTAAPLSPSDPLLGRIARILVASVEARPAEWLAWLERREKEKAS